MVKIKYKLMGTSQQGRRDQSCSNVGINLIKFLDMSRDDIQ